jgi:ATP-dependent helicase Lhr and Lhr-like helicase
MNSNGFASGTQTDAALGLLSDPVRDWFTATFPGGPTPAQLLAWPPIAAGDNVLLVAPTGTGKTLAAFLAILDRLCRAREAGKLAPGLRCVYVSPLRSLNYDIERNLRVPLEGIRARLKCTSLPVRVGVRTGDTSAYERQKLRDHPPHILITTPESLSLLLSQPRWQGQWSGVEHIVVDEVHALVPTKRGADLAVSLERLAACAARDPIRVGLSATCHAEGTAARFLVGPGRSCRVVEAARPAGAAAPQIEVASLIGPGEAPHGGLAYRRLLKHLHRAIGRNRTTIVFANTRALAEKVTYDLRQDGDTTPAAEETVAAHHSALDAQRRRDIESRLRDGKLRAVVTSTSLELGVDIGTADLAVQIGAVGSVAKCLQRVGRAGHRLGARPRGLLLAATAAELAAAAVTAQAARAGRVEPLKMVRAPLDVACQQLIGMACAGVQSDDDAFALLRKAAPMAELTRDDFEECLAFLAGELPGRAWATGPESEAAPQWTAPRLWRRAGQFGVRSRRVARWFACNVGTIQTEETAVVLDRGVAVGTVEAAYAERLVPGDRFVLDGRTRQFTRLERSIVHTRPHSGAPSLPRWTSDRQSLSAELAGELAEFRAQAALRLLDDGPAALCTWLVESFELDFRSAKVLSDLFEAQEQWSEVPGAADILVEECPAPSGEGLCYTFHAPLHRAACEALGRAIAARLGRQFGQNLALAVADLGWSIHLPEDAGGWLAAGTVAPLLARNGFAADVLEGLDRGDFLARRFQHVAATAMMVLRNREPGRRVRVGGLNWVSSRLYPLVKDACPDHPLLRETRREVLEDRLDVPAAERWLASRPIVRCRVLPGLSPFAAAWIEPGGGEPLQFEPPADALRRLHARLINGAKGAGA